ncbi:MAG: ElyC/SanA/YdcF family protein [Vicinamibacterales bacterium]
MKRTFDVVADPAFAGIALLLIGFLAARLKSVAGAGRVMAGLGVFVLAAFSMPVVADMMARPLETEHPALIDRIPPPGVRFVAVLGGGHTVRSDRSTTSLLNPPGRARLIEGVRVCRLIPDCRLIVSGFAAGRSVSLAEAMARAAEDLGIPPRRIVRLDDPHDTEQEMEALKRQVGTERFVLVTSAIHMPRAMDEAGRRGLSAIPAPADYITDQASGWRAWIFSAPALARSDAAIHEHAGRVWGWLRQWADGAR